MRRKDHELAKQRRAAQARKKRLIWIAGSTAVVAVLALIIVGAALRSGGNDPVITASNAQRDGRVLGDSTASVVITAWEDFQCPVCKAANSSVLQTIIQEYVDTGKAQLQYRYYSFLGNESVRAAEAAEAASAQGKFWEYHDALFTNQGAENSGAFSDDRLIQIAQQLGLNMDQFKQALDTNEYEDVVKAELQEGQSRGVTGTPTFFVNGEKVTDWRDLAGFRAQIDSFEPATS
jgi:protein-disulfide isomerase